MSRLDPVITALAVLGLVVAACDTNAAPSQSTSSQQPVATTDAQIERWLLQQSGQTVVAMDYTLAQLLMDLEVSDYELTLSMSVAASVDGILSLDEAKRFCDSLLAKTRRSNLPVEKIKILDLGGAVVATSAEGSCHLVY